MAMVKSFIKKFTRQPEYLGDLKQSSDSKKFILSYGKDDIGYLKFIEKEWIFVYSDWFKHQNRILPLVEFPKKHLVYKSKELWSFFSSRIPSEKQPKMVKLSVEGQNKNIADLLETFGKQSINNPFVLETA